MFKALPWQPEAANRTRANVRLPSRLIFIPAEGPQPLNSSHTSPAGTKTQDKTPEACHAEGSPVHRTRPSLPSSPFCGPAVAIKAGGDASPSSA
jgi:hypothetical protein